MIFGFSFCLIFWFTLYPENNCDIFSSTADLEKLVKIETFLVNTLEQYIHSEEQWLDTLKRNIEVYKKESNKASEDIELYVGNPINAYKLIKRLTTDWKQTKALLYSQPNKEYLEKIDDIKETEFPDEEDLIGAAIGIMKLQHTYHLSTSSLAKGEIKGVNYTSELSAFDCFELGKKLYNTGDYDYAYMWLDEAYSRLKYKAGDVLILLDVHKYLAAARFQRNAMSFEDTTISPRQKIKMKNIMSMLSKVYGIKMEVDKIGVLQQRRNVFSEYLESKQLPITVTFVEELISKLCSGEISQSTNKAAKLKCRYFNGNNPFLTIAPFKVEEAHLQPDILIFHDVIADSEIATIKEVAKPHLERARTFGMKTSEVRTAKTMFLTDEEEELLPNLSQRVTDMTGLTMETAEKFSVVNYGIGGLYEPHYDFHDVGKKNEEFGDRIATALFYISDVKEGGATIFPLLNVTVWPHKGSAVLWYNLLSDGNGDQLSLHAGCPVLLGSKWIVNKWIRERGQEFLKPCDLINTNQSHMDESIINDSVML